MTVDSSKISFPKAVCLSLVAAGVFAGIIVLATFASGGAALAARSATDFAMPLGILWLLFLAGCINSWLLGNRIVAGLFAIAFLALGFAFNGSLTARWVESKEFPMQADHLALEQRSSSSEQFDVVVILGGCARVNRFEVTELTQDGERLVSAAQMWHAGQAKYFICTGTGHSVYAKPSELGREILVSLGVPDKVIFEVKGDNTSEEMRGLREFFASPPEQFKDAFAKSSEGNNEIGGVQEIKLGLSTSAFHLPRALRLAETEALSFVPLPCCYRGHVESNWTAREIIPRAGAGIAFEIAWKETLARWVGR